jgi:glycosyltransferase involved in cell wall biosynthesis
MESGDTRAERRQSNPKRLVVVLAASIPPVQGQALIAQRVSTLLAAEGHETCLVSRNPRTLSRGLPYYLALVGGVWRAVRLCLSLRRRCTKSIYVTSSGGLGVLAEGLCVALLRRRSDPLVVHHHSFAYLNAPSVAFWLVNASVYRRATHVVLCAHMGELLHQRGVDMQHIFVVSNAAFIDTPAKSEHPTPRLSPKLRVGHLSNLTTEKGLDLVLGVLECTDDVVLAVYGEPTDPSAADLLSDALRRFPDRLTHVRPTDREGVWTFLASIDLFLFPSRYPNEAAPLVVLEALSAGVPVVASDRGCIPSQLRPELGDFVVPLDQFASRTSTIIREMLSNPEYRAEVTARAMRQWDWLLADAQQDTASLLALVVPDSSR